MPRRVNRLTTIIRKLIKEYEKKKQMTPCQINGGWCADFALEAKRRLDDVDAKIRADTDSRHTWLEFEGKHYDSEAPDGVEDWRELPLFKNSKSVLPTGLK